MTLSLTELLEAEGIPFENRVYVYGKHAICHIDGYPVSEEKHNNKHQYFALINDTWVCVLASEEECSDDDVCVAIRKRLCP